MEWSQLFSGILPLIGVILGGGVTYLTQSLTFKKQLESEAKKNKEAKNVERLTVYSEILKVEGENTVYENTGTHIEFNLTVFIRKIRPVFYSKYYLLHQTIADEVRKMDKIIAEANFNAELERRQNDLLLNIFNKIIGTIEMELKKYREN